MPPTDTAQRYFAPVEDLARSLDDARDRRDAVAEQMQALLTAAETRGEDRLPAADQRIFDRLARERDQLAGEVDDLTTQLVGASAEQRDTTAAAGAMHRTLFGAAQPKDGATGEYLSISEPPVYRRTDNPNAPSIVRDIASQARGNRDAYDRLKRNTAMVESAWEKRTGMTTVNGAGGEFAPPLWQVDEYVALARAARPLADRLTKGELPPGASSINLPSITVGSTVAAQTTQNTAVSNTTPTTSSVTDTVHTVAGFVQISQQEIDQSPVNMDTVVLSNLTAAYSAVLDTAVITALVAGASTSNVTFTNATPTTPLLVPNVANQIANVNTNRYLPPDTIAMTPARWQLLLAAQDSTGHAFFSNLQNFNAQGEGTDVLAQGTVGSLFGLPVVVDPNIPTNLGAGTNQDEIIVLRGVDNVLYESIPYLDAQPGQFASSLSVVLRFWRYYSLLVRYPKGISVLSGTGMIPYAYAK